MKQCGKNKLSKQTPKEILANGITCITNNNPDNIFKSGILDVNISRLLPKKPKGKGCKRVKKIK